MSTKIGAAKKTRTSRLAMDGGATETESDAGSEPRIAIVVEKEIKSCKRNAMLHGAELCRSVRLYLDALLGLPKNDVLCVQRVRVSDYKHTEQCAKFEDNQGDPAEMDLGKISDAELSNLYDAQRRGRRNDGPGGDHKANLARFIKRTYRECHTKFGLSDD